MPSMTKSSRVFALCFSTIHIMVGKCLLVESSYDVSLVGHFDVWGGPRSIDLPKLDEPATDERSTARHGINFDFAKANHYFHSELRHLSKQSMKLGGCMDDVSDDTQSRSYYVHLQKSVQAELEYVRAMKSKMRALKVGTNRTVPESCGNHAASYLLNQVNDPVCSRDVSDFSDYWYNETETKYWEGWSYDDMYDDLECEEHADNQDKPFYSPQMWRIIRGKYMEHTGVPFDTLFASNRGQPYYTSHSEGKGRGIFASRNIKKGELVHDGGPDSVFFRDGASFRRFVMSLDRDMGCDVLEWAWLQDVTNTGEYLICLNLDDGAFMNCGGETGANVAPKVSSSLQFYATRDIDEGEEILQDYGVLFGKFSEFGL